ncbi:MAG TPA: DUF2141 domain-containing protein [Steroidobacteraceae bacterium]|nr:DUF2141 domain-containing protein [Steroidobacteraceae bacterium]
MNTQLIVSSIVAAGFFFPATFARGGELTVTITDVRINKGTLRVAVVSSEAGWNNQEKPVAYEQVALTDKAVADKAVVVRFKVPAGSYGVQVMHDENDNGKLDTNVMGIPVEGYGFSNNPQVMRRAYFSEAKFDVADVPTAVTVKLR